MNIHRILWGAALAVPMTFLAGVTHGAPPAMNAVTPQIAAARLSVGYGIEIQLPANTSGRLTMTADADGGTRLQAVNALATVLGLDFTKTFVVRKAAGGQTIAPKVDSVTSIPFEKTTLPVAEAIALVAGVDDATALIAGDVSGTVTLSAPTLTAAQAAQEIADQTKTNWRTVYVLAPRPRDPARSGTLVGYTTAGTPIFEMPAIYFIDWKKEAQMRREEEAAEQRAEQQAQQAQAAALQQAAQQQQAVAAAQATLRTAAASGYLPNGYGMNSNPGAYGVPNGYSASVPNNGIIFSGNGY